MYPEGFCFGIQYYWWAVRNSSLLKRGKKNISRTVELYRESAELNGCSKNQWVGGGGGGGGYKRPDIETGSKMIILEEQEGVIGCYSTVL